MTLDPLPPHDIAAEECVVASCMVDAAAIAKVAAILSPNDFSREVNKWVYEAELEIWRRDGEAAINQVTLAHELGRQRRLKSVGGLAYLSKLVTDLPTPVGVEFYAQIVQETATRRRLLQASGRIAQMAYEGELGVGEILGRSETLLQALRNGNGPVAAEQLDLVCLADVEREEIAWLWDRWLPKGRITILAGDPGVGKGWVSLAIVTALTRGIALPGGKILPSSNVLLLEAEDGLGDTIRPRAEDMGADLKRITALKSIVSKTGQERFPSLVHDLPLLEEHLKSGLYSLVIADPINSYLGADFDSYKDAEVRAVLAPLHGLAERYGVAFLAVIHLNKQEGRKGIYRVLGGIANIAVGRTAWLVAKTKDDPKTRVMRVMKNNLSAEPPAITFKIEEGQFTWGGESTMTEAEMLRGTPDEESKTVFDEACEFLKEELANGLVESNELIKNAKAQDIGRRTLYMAKKALQIKASHHQVGSRKWWSWSLPSTPWPEE